MHRCTMRALRAALLLAVTGITLISAAPASAGEYAVPFCTNNPTGATPGWSSSETGGTAGGAPYFYGATNCGLGGYGMYRRFEVNTVAAGASSDFYFNAPADTYISRLYMSQDAQPRSPGSADAIYASLQDGTRSTVAIALGGSGTLSGATYTLPSSGSRAMKIQSSLFCQSGGNCSGTWGGAYGNEYVLWGGTVYLTDPSLPSIATPGGAGWQSSPPDGVQPITYSVTDQGSGVREVRLYVDEILVETDSSSCTNNTLVPCPKSTTGQLVFDTTRLSEGQHKVSIVAIDASGNITPQADRELTATVRRAPQASSAAPPTATAPSSNGGGSPTVGNSVTGNPGNWSGTGLTFAYQWMRCDQNGLNCVPIQGATGLNYTPTSADVGKTLVFCVTASNSGGETESCSAPTPAVVAAPAAQTPSSGTTAADAGGTPIPVNGANGTNGANGVNAGERVTLTAVTSSRTTVQKVRYGRKVPLTGRLTRPDGSPIAGASVVVQTQTAVAGAAMSNAAAVTTGPDGRFAYTAPAGPSRLVRFAYRAQSGDSSFTDTTDVRLLVMAGVTLKAAPRKVKNKKATVFTGRVLGRPIPKRGVLVDLQVFYRKKWRTFGAPRANARGAYRFKYRFTAGAATWKFRARVRPGGDYPYELGMSKQRKVTVTR